MYARSGMAYPAKTDRQAILSAALEQLTRNEMRALSLRGLAASLGIAPNALYRYFGPFCMGLLRSNPLSCLGRRSPAAVLSSA